MSSKAWCATHRPGALRRTLYGARKRLGRGAELAGDWLFRQHAAARLARRDHVLCLGDSHVAVMRHVRVPGVWFRAKPLVGATASGVLNPQSKTASLDVFGAHIARARPWQQALLQLGEVDCGFVIWHRARRHGLEVAEQLALTIDSYAGFIERVRDAGFARVIVLSVPLPTIGDDPEQWGEIANMRRSVTATQLQRTDLTLEFNAALQRRCAELGVVFVDVTSGHLDPASGLVDARFVRATDQDHHLADAPFAALVSEQLSRYWR